MLLCQNRCRHKIDHLFILLYRLKGRPNSDLRLAVAHIAANQTVHNPAALHILLGGCDGTDLILCLLEGKHLLELPLPDSVLAILESLALLPDRIQLHQILGYLIHRRTYF